MAVSSDPLDGAEVPLAVAARELDAVRFGSDAELREALQRARAVTLRGVVAGGG